MHSVPTPHEDPFERYAVGDLGRRFGDFLRHNGKTGGWYAGINNDEVELGTHFVVIYEESYVGYTKWTDAKPEKALVALRSGPDLRALRESLGDLDQEQWPDRTTKGRPRDPWHDAVLMPFVNSRTLEGFSFSTSNFGGVQAARNLIRNCVAERRSAPEETRGRLPLVEIGERSYQSTDRRFGTIYNPTFGIVKWVPASTIANTLHLMGVPIPEAIEHKATVTPIASKATRRADPSQDDGSEDEPDVTGSYED